MLKQKNSTISLSDSQKLWEIYRTGKYHNVLNEGKKLLNLNPHHVDVQFVMAMACIELRKWTEAEKYLLYCLAARPQEASYHNNLGVVLMRQRDYQRAEQCYLSAIAQQPDYYEAYINCADNFMMQNKIPQAIEWLKKAKYYRTGLIEDFFNVFGIKYIENKYYQLAGIFFKAVLDLGYETGDIATNYAAAIYNAGYIKKGIKIYEEYLKKYPTHLGLLVNYSGAILVTRQGDLAKVMQCLQTAYQENPEKYLTNYLLAKIHIIQGNNELAELHAQKAMQIKPVAFSDILREVGEYFSIQDDLDKAERVYQILIEKDPEYWPAYEAYGRFLLRQETQFALARSYFVMTLRRCPEMDHLYNDLALTYWKLGKFAKAGSYIKRGLQRYPNHPDMLWARGTYAMLHGDFATCWDNFSARYDKGENNFLLHDNLSEEVLSKNQGALLVHGEQGVGDEVMFSNCLLALKDSNFEIIYVADKRLVPLFQRSMPWVKLVERSEYQTTLELYSNELHVTYVASLGKFFRRCIEDFPVHQGYLFADPQQVATFRQKIAALGKRLTIGITWRSMSLTTRWLRNIPLQNWSWITAFPECAWINLQFGETQREVNDFIDQAGEVLHTFAEVDPMEELDDFAALVSCCDLVIAIDNSTAHLAAALNVPTWILLPKGNDYRWMLDTERTPWYPAVTLLRQQEFANWGPLLAELPQRLRHWLAQQKQEAQ